MAGLSMHTFLIKEDFVTLSRDSYTGVNIHVATWPFIITIYGKLILKGHLNSKVRFSSVLESHIVKPSTLNGISIPFILLQLYY